MQYKTEENITNLYKLKNYYWLSNAIIKNRLNINIIIIFIILRIINALLYIEY